MPKPDELIFALKTFAGAMAAFYLSCWLGLENPYWALATAYIIAQPFAGAVRSKAVYRLFGTLIGGAAAIAMGPNLVNAPVLLCGAMALWTGICLYISLLDRTPRAYTFMLAGYTASIIAFPTVTMPGQVFDVAVARIEEIGLGIACTTVINVIVFPRALGPVLMRRVMSWIKPGVDWAVAGLAGEGDTPQARQAQRHLATEAADTAMLITHLAYDISHLQEAVRHIARLRIYLISLMPVLASISDKVAELKRLGGMTPALQAVLERIAGWLQGGEPDGAIPMLDEIRALANEPADHWLALLRASLALRLEELVRISYHSRRLRQHIVDGVPVPPTAELDAEYIAVIRQHHDHKLALLSALAAMLTLLLVSAIWIQTAWSYGAGAAVIAVVGCSIFAALDDPAPALVQLFRNLIIVLAGVFVYNFGILPKVTGFDLLCLVLLPAGLIVGVLVSRPASFGTGMVLGAFGGTQLALENGYTGNFVAYANGAISLVLGVGTALIMTRLIRSVGAAWSAEQLLRANWRDVAAAAEADSAYDRATLTGLMMDRLGLAMPRLAAAAPGADSAALGIMRDLRVGLDVIALHREQWRLPLAARNSSARVFAEVARHYRTAPREPAPPALRAAIDAAMAELAGDPQTYLNALMTLSDLRGTLFLAAPPPDFFVTRPRVSEVS